MFSESKSSAWSLRSPASAKGNGIDNTSKSVARGQWLVTSRFPSRHSALAAGHRLSYLKAFTKMFFPSELAVVYSRRVRLRAELGCRGSIFAEEASAC